MNEDVFELAKRVDIKGYLESHYAFRFRNNKILCPFHEEKNPSFTLYPADQMLHCFGGCNWNDGKSSGDIIAFVSKYKGIGKLDAAKLICDDNGISYNRHEMKGGPDNSKSSSQSSEAEKIKQIHEEMKEKAKLFIIQASTTYKEECDKALNEVLINKDLLPNEWKKCYLGWDQAEQSLVIINQTPKTDQVWNIKHKKKKGFDGKWISFPKSQTFPFPFSYFRQHKDNKVILCEGEKDALNLLSIGVNCLTLGGAGTSWYRHKQLLKDKEVYIWFDNDQTGYDNAIRRYDELKDVAKKVYLVLFCGMAEKFPDHYDISDFIKDHKVSHSEELYSLMSNFSFIDRDQAIRVVDQKYKLRDIASSISEEKVTSEPTTAKEPGKHNYYWLLSSTLLTIIIFLTAISWVMHNNLQYEFYTLKRVITFSTFLIISFFAYKEEDIRYTVIFGIMAFLFNPLRPFYLTREIWVIIDAIVLLNICYFLIFRIKVFKMIKISFKRSSL